MSIFGFSLIRTSKLMAIYEKMAIFALDKIKQNNSVRMTISGTITAISPLQSGISKAGKEWKKIDCVLVYDNYKPEYPKSIVFSVMNDKIEEFKLEVDKAYDVEVDFSVREYNGKNYMSANAWKVTAKDTPSATAHAPQQATQAETKQAGDDLPF